MIINEVSAIKRRQVLPIPLKYNFEHMVLQTVVEAGRGIRSESREGGMSLSWFLNPEALASKDNTLPLSLKP